MYVGSKGGHVILHAFLVTRSFQDLNCVQFTLKGNEIVYGLSVLQILPTRANLFWKSTTKVQFSSGEKFAGLRNWQHFYLNKFRIRNKS